MNRVVVTHWYDAQRYINVAGRFGMNVKWFCLGLTSSTQNVRCFGSSQENRLNRRGPLLK